MSGGGVVISPNIKREKVQINAEGDEVIPFTKQVIKKNDPGYVPTPEEIAAAAAKPAQDPGRPEDLPEGGAGGTGPFPGATSNPAPAPAQSRPTRGPKKAPSAIGDLVKQQLQAEIQSQLLDAMKEIDMASMVRDAIKEAFKP